MSRTNLQRWLELLSRLSLGAQYRLAAPIAALMAHTPNQISRQARANIGLCFGDLGNAERRRLYHEAIRHTCYTMTELGAIWRRLMGRHYPAMSMIFVADLLDHPAKIELEATA